MSIDGMKQTLAATMIEDCENRCEKMTEWEVTFIDSLKHQLARSGGSPSPKQEEILDRIWEKVTR